MDSGVQHQTWIEEIISVSTFKTKRGMQGILSYINPRQGLPFSRGRQES